MPPKADSTFEVHIRIPEAFTLDSIVRSPRTFKPKDVVSACQNNDLVLKDGNPPEEVISMITYVMTDFFAMAHGTGLYNRQRNLWESLSKINSIAITQLSAGLLKKRELPVYDIHFLDYKGKPLVFATLICEIPEKETAVKLLKQALGRAGGKSSLTGFLCCFPAPCPEEALQFIQKATNTSDHIGRYESILPSLHVPVDLLEMEKTNMVELSQEGSEPAELRNVFQLVHPDLKKGKSVLPAAPPLRKASQKKKLEDAGAAESEPPASDEQAISS